MKWKFEQLAPLEVRMTVLCNRRHRCTGLAASNLCPVRGIALTYRQAESGLRLSSETDPDGIETDFIYEIEHFGDIAMIGFFVGLEFN